MAGQYYQDPRVFYFVSADQKLSSLDDLFNQGKKESKFVESALKQTQGKDKDKDESGESKKDEANKKKVEENSKIQTIEMNVNLCCDRCEEKVNEALWHMEGVERVDCDQVKQKVIVKGSVKPEAVLKKVKKVRKSAVLVEKK